MFDLSYKNETLDGQVTVKIKKSTIDELATIGYPSTTIRRIVEHALGNWEEFQKIGGSKNEVV